MKVEVKKFNAAPSELYNSAYQESQIAACNLQWIHWHVKGKHFEAIHNLTEAYYDKLRDEMDCIAELMMRHGIQFKNLIDINTPDAESALEYDSSNSYEAIKRIIESYLAKLRLLSNASGSDEVRSEQGDLDGFISYWDKELNYKLNAKLD